MGGGELSSGETKELREKIKVYSWKTGWLPCRHNPNTDGCFSKECPVVGKLLETGVSLPILISWKCSAKWSEGDVLFGQCTKKANRARNTIYAVRGDTRKGVPDMKGMVMDTCEDGDTRDVGAGLSAGGIHTHFGGSFEG